MLQLLSEISSDDTRTGMVLASVPAIYTIKAISLQSGVITSHLGVGVALARPFSIFWIKLVVMSLSVKRQGRCSNLWEHGHKFDPFLMSFGGLRWRLGHFLMIFVEVRLSWFGRYLNWFVGHSVLLDIDLDVLHVPPLAAGSARAWLRSSVVSVLILWWLRSCLWRRSLLSRRARLHPGRGGWLLLLAAVDRMSWRMRRKLWLWTMLAWASARSVCGVLAWLWEMFLLAFSHLVVLFELFGALSVLICFDVLFIFQNIRLRRNYPSWLVCLETSVKDHWVLCHCDNLRRMRTEQSPKDIIRYKKDLRTFKTLTKRRKMQFLYARVLILLHALLYLLFLSFGFWFFLWADFILWFLSLTFATFCN